MEDVVDDASRSAAAVNPLGAAGWAGRRRKCWRFFDHV
jgi:hypothetical protein